MKQKPRLSLRMKGGNDNHHLWNNRGIWWCHFTIHKADATAERYRFSLRTSDLEKARERRDRILRDIAHRFGLAA